MPGPKSEHKTRGPRPDPNGNARVPNAKQAARLKARQDAFSPSNDKFRAGYNLAGSENRNK